MIYISAIQGALFSLAIFYVYFKHFLRIKDLKISEVKFSRLLVWISFYVVLPILMILSYFFDEMKWIYLPTSTVIFYFLRVRLKWIYLYLPVFLFYPEKSLFFYLSLPLLIKVRARELEILPSLVFIYFLSLSCFSKHYPEAFYNIIPYIIYLIPTLHFNKLFNKKYIPIAFFGATSLLLLVLKDVEDLALVVFSIILTLILKWDERIPVAHAIAFLIFAAIYLAFGMENFANELAVVSYWNLVVGVTCAFINTVRENNRENGGSGGNRPGEQPKE